MLPWAQDGTSCTRPTHFMSREHRHDSCLSTTNRISCVQNRMAMEKDKEIHSPWWVLSSIEQDLTSSVCAQLKKPLKAGICASTQLIIYGVQLMPPATLQKATVPQVLCSITISAQYRIHAINLQQSLFRQMLLTFSLSLASFLQELHNPLSSSYLLLLCCTVPPTLRSYEYKKTAGTPGSCY